MHVSFCHQNKPIKGVCCKEQLAHHSPFQSPRFLWGSVSLRDSRLSLPVPGWQVCTTFGIWPDAEALTWVLMLGQPWWSFTKPSLCFLLPEGPCILLRSAWPMVQHEEALVLLPCFLFFRLEPRPAHVSQKKALDITHPLLIPQCPIQALMATQSLCL